MQNTPTTIIALGVAVVLILIVPLGTMLARNDNVTQQYVEAAVDDLVLEIQNTGKLTRTMYQNFVNQLATTGNTYDIDMEFHILDENPGKKTSQANYTKIGENVYVIYTETQYLPKIGIELGNQEVSNNDTVTFKEGDMIYVTVQNTSTTGKQKYNSSLFGYSNADEVAISASGFGMITVNGSN